eukprot:CAMPEP_0183742612 /NCGR_PEP_ID=MMETSP0737-20130205/64788_1 /TAXON_ID=385413 /ORGANISM="Thalassiosira miniscula, Strain CCMP1093" /LENGTH=577 /DNA_ID=CAMNT_0025978201 /DNA_START=112 /DNA_END=1845 /DNA_ORIENTATION=+
MKLDQRYFNQVAKKRHNNHVLESYKAVYARSTMVLFSRETHTPLAALTLKSTRDIGCLSLLTGRPSPKENAAQLYFQGMLNMPDQNFSLVITNLSEDGMVNFNVLHTPHQVSEVDPGPTYGVNEVNELHKSQSYEIVADQRTNRSMVLKGKTESKIDPITKQSRTVPLTVDESECTKDKAKEGLYFYLSVVPDNSSPELVKKFKEGTVWKAVSGFVMKKDAPPTPNLHLRLGASYSGESPSPYLGTAAVSRFRASDAELERALPSSSFRSMRAFLGLRGPSRRAALCSSSSSSSSSRMPSGSAYIPPSRANSNRSPPMANTASAPTYSSVPPPYIPPSPASSMSPPSPVAAAMPQAQRRRIFGLPRGDQYSFLPVPQALDFSSRSDRYAIPTSLSTPPALSQAHWEQVDDLHDEFFCLSEGASSEPDNSLESAHFADNVDVGSTQAGELGYGEHVTVQSGCTGHEYAYEYASEPTVLCMSIWEDMKFLPLLDSVEKMLEEEVDELIENEGKALIKSLNAVFKETKCVIDLESEADTIVCTCGHQCINHANVSSNIRRCPLCRCPVTAFVRANGLIIF